MFAVAFRTYRTYENKTSPQEVLVFGLKFKPMSVVLALIMDVALISLFYRFYSTKHFEKVPSLKKLVHHRNMM